MKRAFTKLSVILIAILLAGSSVLQAQNILWMEEFDGGLGNWTVADSSLQQSGDAWVHTTTGPSGSFAIDPIASTTAGNGYAMFDSDLQCSGSQNSWLVSPVIDLAGIDSAVLVFEQYFVSYHDACYVNVSNDGGATWTSIEINAGIPDNAGTTNPEVLEMDLTDYIAGSAMAHIAFQFWSDNPADALAGCGYAWEIDDVRLQDAVTPPPPPDPNILWTETFDGGMRGWENNTVFSDIDTAEWVWEATGSVGSGQFAGDNTAIQSETADNGAMVFNADLFITGGDNAPPYTGAQPYPESVAELISPSIDLTGNRNPISVKFTQLARILNIADSAPDDALGNVYHTFVSFSADGGTTWSNYLDANPDLGPNDGRGTVTTTLPLAGVKDVSDLKIKFTYASDFYYWAVDDIQIIKRLEHDMRANEYYAIATNAVTPASQVDELSFICDIENIGGQDEDNVNLNITIEDALTGMVVHSEDQPYGSIESDSLAENVYFGSFTPAPMAANYVGRYSLTYDSIDVDIDPNNNIIEWDFDISENLFAKEKGATTSIAASADNSWAYGNVFWVPNGQGHYAKTITFGVSNADDLAGETITTKLLKWEGDTDESGSADPEEYQVIAFNGYIFNGTENDQILEIPVDIDGNDISLEDGFYYIAVVEYEDRIGQQAFVLTSYDYDYSAMVNMTDALGRPRYASVLDVGLAGEYNLVGFAPGGFDNVPTVRLTVDDISSTKEELSSENVVKVFPNPAEEMINLELDLVETADVVKINLIDMQGKTLRNAKLENVNNGTYQFRVQDLTAGSYVLRLITEEGVRSVTFIKK